MTYKGQLFIYTWITSREIVGSQRAKGRRREVVLMGGRRRGFRSVAGVSKADPRARHQKPRVGISEQLARITISLIQTWRSTTIAGTRTTMSDWSTSWTTNYKPLPTLIR
jgi:hypothetical protein